jgi:hypothetical protein
MEVEVDKAETRLLRWAARQSREAASAPQAAQLLLLHKATREPAYKAKAEDTASALYAWAQEHLLANPHIHDSDEFTDSDH